MHRVYSEAQHLIIPFQFREVAETPTKVLIKLLKDAKFIIKEG
jgi:toprim domain protein